MSEVIYFELKVFLIFWLHGMCLLLGNDLLFCLRLAIPHNNLWIGLEDALFWFASGLWTFVLIFVYQDGVLRLYVALAIGLGMFLYRKTLSKWVIKIISKPLCLFFGFISKISKKFEKIRKKLLQNLSKKDKLKRKNLGRFKRGK